MNSYFSGSVPKAGVAPAASPPRIPSRQRLYSCRDSRRSSTSSPAARWRAVSHKRGASVRCAVENTEQGTRKRPSAIKSVATSYPEPPQSPNGDESSRSSESQEMSFVDTYRKRTAAWLLDIDNAGFWSVGSGLLALNTFLLETVNDSRFGGWDVLFRDDLNVFYYGLSTSTIGYLENVTTLLFATEFIARAWCADDKRKFLLSPFTLIDGISALPAVLSLLGADQKIQRICRLLRVLRLLRLLEREPDSVLFGVMQSNEMSVQLIGVAAEFVCIFCVSAGVIYDLEYGVNEHVHTLADTLYWAFLTLTGIGQPFEIETPAGKVATVLSVLVALIVVPGQLAKLAAASSGRMMMEAMNAEEEAIAYDYQIGAGVRPPRPSARATADKTKVGPASAVGAMGKMGRVGAVLAAQEAAMQVVVADAQANAAVSASARAAGAALNDGGVTVRRFRRIIVTLRTCDNCGLEEHDLDAAYCKACGSIIPQVVLQKPPAAATAVVMQSNGNGNGNGTGSGKPE